MKVFSFVNIKDDNDSDSKRFKCYYVNSLLTKELLYYAYLSHTVKMCVKGNPKGIK